MEIKVNFELTALETDHLLAMYKKHYRDQPIKMLQARLSDTCVRYLNSLESYHGIPLTLSVDWNTAQQIINLSAYT